MTYTKIRLDFMYGPKNRFYRTLLVKGNPDLFKLGVAFGTALGATFEHCFLITCFGRNNQYVMAPFMEDPIDGYKYLGKYHLDDLPEKFTYEYDTGEGWDFSCKKYKKLVEVESTDEIILIEAKGQGIWEDNISSLYCLFNNEIEKDYDEEDDERGIFKPWNCFVDKYSDFDLDIDIDEENETLNEQFEVDYKEVLKNEKRYIKETNVCLNDFHDNDTYNRNLNGAIMSAVEEQIESLSYVKKVFDKLKESNDEYKSKELIASVLVTYIFDLGKSKKTFDEKEYKKRLLDLLSKKQ